MRTVELDKNDLESIALGACLLASGGGGTYTSGRHLLRQFRRGAYYPSAKTSCVDVGEIPGTSSDRGIVVAYMGAPAAIERLDYPQAAVNAALAAKKWLESQKLCLAYVVPVEIGALSSLVACTVATKLGVPVVDGDGAGRAVPSLPSLTFAGYDISTNPTFLADEKDALIHLEVRAGRGGPDTLVEEVARSVVSQDNFGQKAGLAIWVMTPEQMREAIQARGTLTACRDLGRKLARMQRRASLPISDLMGDIARALDAKVFSLAEGTLVKAENVTSGGFDHGQTLIRTKQGDHCTVISQNENLIAWSSGASRPMAMAPDSIAYVLHDRQIAYSNGDLVDPTTNKLKKQLEHCKVTLLGITANPALRRHHARRAAPADSAARLAGNEIARSFQQALNQLGYFGAYVPVEKLQRGA